MDQVYYFDIGNGNFVFGKKGEQPNSLIAPLQIMPTPDGKVGITPYGYPVVQSDPKDLTEVVFSNFVSTGTVTDDVADAWLKTTSRIEIAKSNASVLNIVR